MFTYQNDEYKTMLTQDMKKTISDNRLISLMMRNISQIIVKNPHSVPVFYNVTSQIWIKDMFKLKKNVVSLCHGVRVGVHATWPGSATGPRGRKSSKYQY